MTSPMRPIACESRAHHADRAEVVENVFGRDRFAANAAFGERHILRQIRIEMMADHQHVEMLVDAC